LSIYEGVLRTRLSRKSGRDSTTEGTFTMPARRTEKDIRSFFGDPQESPKKRRLTEQEELAQALKESQENSQEEEGGSQTPSAAPAAAARLTARRATRSRRPARANPRATTARMTRSPPPPAPRTRTGCCRWGPNAAVGGAPLSATALVAAETAEANMSAAYIAQLHREDEEEREGNAGRDPQAAGRR